MTGLIHAQGADEGVNSCQWTVVRSAGKREKGTERQRPKGAGSQEPQSSPTRAPERGKER
jgi:hypothetical protein